jgi:uncharacterized protein (DUF1697 family)
MPVFAALLRAVNVGGRNLIRMPLLTELCEGLGHTGVRTLLQSGNVVFRSRSAASAPMAKRLQDAIEKRCGFRPAIFLRSLAEISEAIAANPFPDAARDDPGHLLILFLDGTPPAGADAALSGFKGGPERVKLEGRNLYLHYPAGSGTSKLTNAVIEKAIGTPGTARNWNTLNKLAELMQAADRRR